MTMYEAVKVEAILLAAGRSVRMGQTKQLLPISGKPAVAVCVETLLAGGVEGIVVVVNEEGDEVVRALENYPVRFVRNEIRGSEMADSIRAAVGVLQGPGPVAVHPCDCPLVAPATVRALVTAAGSSPGAIHIPGVGGRGGHPVILPREVLEEIAWRPTLRHVIGAHRELVRLVEVEDVGARLDMDTPDDYRRMLAVCAEMSDRA